MIIFGAVLQVKPRVNEVEGSGSQGGRGGRAGSNRRPGSNPSARTFKAKRVEVESCGCALLLPAPHRWGEGRSRAGQGETSPASTSVTDPISPADAPSYLTLCDICRGVSISSKMAPFTLEPRRFASCRSQPERSQFCRERGDTQYISEVPVFKRHCNAINRSTVKVNFHFDFISLQLCHKLIN